MVLYKLFPSVFLFLASLIFVDSAYSQENKIAATTPELYNQIAYMDSALFTAFNAQNMGALKSYFTEDLEWFQDNGGLLSYETVFENFATTFKKPFRLTRELVQGSLEVHPVKNYGAIEIGVHRFRHLENGKEEIGIFKFLMIWQNKNGLWKISRVISYDH
ncbi:MAG: nuclear transport factor 2 family protein [Chitinophagales bacterium]|nr:nuclear transport factor 2 family protein [Chitinophagales bacterium]